jgi:hypothetical protein
MPPGAIVQGPSSQQSILRSGPPQYQSNLHIVTQMHQTAYTSGTCRRRFLHHVAAAESCFSYSAFLAGSIFAPCFS